jgi:hypothetical protein
MLRQERHDNNGCRHIALQLPLDRERLGVLPGRLELRALRPGPKQGPGRQRVRLLALRTVGSA